MAIIPVVNLARSRLSGLPEVAISQLTRFGIGTTHEADTDDVKVSTTNATLILTVRPQARVDHEEDIVLSSGVQNH
jgi:hypothetical protein